MTDYLYAYGRITDEMAGVVRRVQEFFEELDALPRWRLLRRRRCKNEVTRWLDLLADLRERRARLIRLMEFEAATTPDPKAQNGQTGGTNESPRRTSPSHQPRQENRAPRPS